MSRGVVIAGVVVAVAAAVDELGALRKALGKSAWILTTTPRVQARMEQDIEVR